MFHSVFSIVNMHMQRVFFSDPDTIRHSDLENSRFLFLKISAKFFDQQDKAGACPAGFRNKTARFPLPQKKEDHSALNRSSVTGLSSRLI